MSGRFVILGGNGILPPIIDLDEEERRKEAEAAERIKQEVRDAAEAQHLEQVSLALGEIEAAFEKVVAVELEEEKAAAISSARRLSKYKADFAAFQKFCQNYPTPLPYLPAPAQAVVAYIAEITGKGSIDRALAAISRAHQLAHLPDPCEDLLVKATVRYCKNPPLAAKPANLN